MRLTQRLPQSPLWRRRAIAGAIVLLLHGLVLALFAVRRALQAEEPTRETIITLSEPARRSAAPAPPSSRASLPPSLFRLPPSSSLPFAENPAIIDLFGNCAPENLSRLSAEQRARCRTAGFALGVPPGLDAQFEQKSRVQDEARWMAALERKNSPILLPGGVWLPFLAVGALLGDDNILLHPDQWPYYSEHHDEAVRLKNKYPRPETQLDQWR